MMKCLSLIPAPLSYALEYLGVYEPEITDDEAYKRLSREAEIWKKFQRNRDVEWAEFQAGNHMQGDLPVLVSKALSYLDRQGIHKGTAVDLGCGISPTTLHLLESGWKVYAVDSSSAVLSRLALLCKKWIEKGDLVLMKQEIETFAYPEKVDLITAMDAIPYCDPEMIDQIFLKAKFALRPKGLFVCTLFPYNDNSLADQMIHQLFGGWITTKNVIEAVMRSVEFTSWTVQEGQSPSGRFKQFHITAS